MKVWEGPKHSWLPAIRCTPAEYRSVKSAASKAGKKRGSPIGIGRYLIGLHHARDGKRFEACPAPDATLSKRLPGMRCTKAEYDQIEQESRKNGQTISRYLISLHVQA